MEDLFGNAAAFPVQISPRQLHHRGVIEKRGFPSFSFIWTSGDNSLIYKGLRTKLNGLSFPLPDPFLGKQYQIAVSDLENRGGGQILSLNVLGKHQRQRDFSWTAKNQRLFLPLIVENAHVQNINQNVNCFVLLPSINVLIFSSQLKREG